MAGIKTLATPRLLLESMASKHLPFLVRLWRDPRLGVRTAQQAIEWLEQSDESWRRWGHGCWIGLNGLEAEMIGYAALTRRTIAGRNELEVAYAVMPDRWGEGLATEMTRAAIAAARFVSAAHTLVARVRPTNRASQRVAEKCGFQYEQTLTHAGATHLIFRHTFDNPLG